MGSLIYSMKNKTLNCRHSFPSSRYRYNTNYWLSDKKGWENPSRVFSGLIFNFYFIQWHFILQKVNCNLKICLFFRAERLLVNLKGAGLWQTCYICLSQTQCFTSDWGQNNDLHDFFNETTSLLLQIFNNDVLETNVDYILWDLLISLNINSFFVVISTNGTKRLLTLTEGDDRLINKSRYDCIQQTNNVFEITYLMKNVWHINTFNSLIPTRM